MGDRQPDALADDELLSRERALLTDISGWYSNTDWGFYTRIVWYTYVAIKPYLHGAARVLEMGCADGEMTRFLKDDVAELHVVDAAEPYVAAAVALGDNVVGHVALFEEFDPRDRFDVIVMAHVLEHVHDPVAVLERARGWLAPQGRIVAVVPNADSLHRRLGVEMGLLEHRAQLNEQDVAIGHRRVYDRAHLDRDLRAAGLQVVAQGGILLKLLSNVQMANLETDQPALVGACFELGRDLPELCSEIYAVAVGSPAPRRRGERDGCARGLPPAPA
jgi:2-polyprenyl-3-methyl-5-hydroxy-6-metoxy-1,4-benzoquinol methylase